MIPLFTNSQVRQADKYAAEQLEIPGIVLMENASLSIFHKINRYIKNLNANGEIGILCGKGNNGGDGFALARHFINNGFIVKILLVASPKNLQGDAKINYNILNNLLVKSQKSKIIEYKNLKSLHTIKNCSVIIDALLGTGTKGELKEPYKRIIEEINILDSIKIAIDNPSGLNSDTGFGRTIFNAELTITLAEFKRGLFFSEGYKNAGKIYKGSIGIGSEYFNNLNVEDYLIEPEDAFVNLPLREKNLNKYSSGKLFVIAGSGKMPRAASFLINAASKVGTGSVFLSFPESVKATIQTLLDIAIVEPYSDENAEILQTKNLSELNEKINWANIIAIGPGLGREEETQKTIREILIKYSNKKFFVIDADALNAFKNNEYKKYNLSNSILTPHHKEFADLLGTSVEEVEENQLQLGKSFATETKSYLILKGAPTIIFTPKGEALINSSGNSGLAKFGSGDVLTGIISGLLSQTRQREAAAIAGVYIHSFVADLLKAEMTEYGFSALDLISKIPETIKFLKDSFV